MTDPRRLVVVGGSLAGLRAVEAARKSGFDGEIALVGEEPRLPYDRPQLTKAVLAEGAPAEVPSFKTATRLLEDPQMTLHLGVRATGLDIESRVVATDNGDLAYDALVLATGSRVRHLPGTQHLSSVHTIRDDHDANRLRASLSEARSLAVVGAGFIGAEIASAARSRGMTVTILEAASAPLAHAVGPSVGAMLGALHHQHGTNLRLGTGVAGVAESKGSTTLTLDDGSELTADLVVVGIGAQPNVEWIGDALPVGNGLICDPDLSVGRPEIAAAGDVCSWVDPRWGIRSRLEHWTTASEQGAHAARTVLSRADSVAYSAIPYFWSEWYGVKIQMVGRMDGDDAMLIGTPEDARYVALYRKGDALWGALTVGLPGETNKLRRLLTEHAGWSEAVDFTRSRVGSDSVTF